MISNLKYFKLMRNIGVKHNFKDMEKIILQQYNADVGYKIKGGINIWTETKYMLGNLLVLVFIIVLALTGGVNMEYKYKNIGYNSLVLFTGVINSINNYLY